MILWARVIRAGCGIGYDVRAVSGAMSRRAVGEQSPPLTREEREARGAMEQYLYEQRLNAALGRSNAITGGKVGWF
jgi:hypothetical protein